MKYVKSTIIILFAVFNFAAYGSGSEKPTKAVKKGDIVGTVIDKSDGKPIEYATVALYSSDSKKLITGGISDTEGFFRLKNNKVGNYYLTVTFLGYETINIPEIKILSDTREIQLGDIKLKSNAREIEGVDVVADQASVQYKIDKKVVNVGQQLTAKSGTAVDILENIPSVKVDIEGNVTLRGSDSFTVLIDGRPTVLDPSDALSQIPAGAIENIELITNPSAKFEPDGAAGIINIVTKKNKMKGLSGIVNVNAGRFENFGGDFTIDSRQDKTYYYIGADYNERHRPGTIDFERVVKYADSENFNVLTLGDFSRNSTRYSIKGGADFSLGKQSVLGFAARYGDRSMSRDKENNYEEYYENSAIHDFYKTKDDVFRGGAFYELNTNFKHNFNEKKTHFIEAQVNYNGRSMDEESENIRFFLDETIASAQKSSEDGPSSGLRLKLDYVQPFNWGGKLEAGWQSHISTSEDFNKVYDYDTVTNSYGNAIAEYSNHTKYTRNTHAAYTTFGGEFGNFGYQAGLRTEYTYRFLELVEKDSTFKIDRPDFFPTIHLSYQMPAEQQVMVSYTRRIKRPRGYYLEPFITSIDAYNVRQGNPDLSPEYINSFDLSYQKKFKKQNFFSVEAYYRITQNKIERVFLNYTNDSRMVLHSYANTGTDYALGVEMMLNYNPAKWYTTNLMADFYDYRLEVANDQMMDQHDFSWNARFNNTIKAGPNTRFQVDFMYQGPTVRSQGSVDEFFSASVAYKQDFLKRKLSATLQVRDVLGTWRHSYTTETSGLYQDTQFIPKTPIVMLTLSYKINNYKVKRGQRGNGNDMDEGGDEM